MADLRLADPKTTECFVALCSEHGLRLPINLHAEDASVIVDADGDAILTVDVNREMPDAQVAAIAQAIVLAVNTCGGFRAEPVEAVGRTP